MPTAIKHQDTQIIIEKLARNKISEAQADAVLRERIAEARPRGLLGQTLAYVARRLHKAKRAPG